MRRFTLFWVCIILSIISLQAQSKTVKKDVKGNYIEQTRVSSNQGKKTTKTYTDSKGNKYVIYKSNNGKLFIWTKDRRGKYIKTYIKQ